MLNPVGSIRVKVNPDLLTNIIQLRKQKNKYEINVLTKPVAFYYLLKTLTTSGIIQNYFEQINEICALCDITKPTFYKRLKECKKLNLLSYSRKTGTITLVSYYKLAETFDYTSTNLVTVEFKPSEQKLHHVLEALYLQLAEQARALAFEKRIKSNPELRKELDKYITTDEKGNYATALKALQIEAFKQGHEKYTEIFLLNPFTTCNSKTMCLMFNFKSEQSIAYLKSKLQRNKLLTVRPQTTISQTNQRIKHAFIKWDNENKRTIWVRPDQLDYAPILQS